jgi:hypothetical protein
MRDEPSTFCFFVETHVRIYAVEFEVRVPKAQLQRAEVELIARRLREMQLRDPDGSSIVIVEVPEN